MRILITGKNGQVGHALNNVMASLGEVVAVDRQQLNLADPDSIRNGIRAIRPDLIINAAAYTAVDQAESEAELAMMINGHAPGILAEEAKRLGAALVHYSTDYVFDGMKCSPYTEEDQPNPMNVYGKSKLLGEQSIAAVGCPYIILRTSWVYGSRGKNFLLTMLRLGKERDELRVVNDQIGAPTWSYRIAQTTRQIVQNIGKEALADRLASSADGGIYHLTASGQTSWCGFAEAIFLHPSLVGRIQPPKVMPISTDKFPLPAVRPQYSIMSNDKLRKWLGIYHPDWQMDLNVCMGELAER